MADLLVPGPHGDREAGRDPLPHVRVQLTFEVAGDLVGRPDDQVVETLLLEDLEGDLGRTS